MFSGHVMLSITNIELLSNCYVHTLTTLTYLFLPILESDIDIQPFAQAPNLTINLDSSLFL